LLVSHKATCKLETPAISKSTASPEQCCDVALLPIASDNSGLLYPDVIVTGLSNFARTGSNTS
jgi:hypothetical protein